MVCFLTSCFQEKGKIAVENGEGEKISIPYYVAYFEDFKKHYTKDDFEYFVEEASNEARLMCKHTPTYEPKSVDVLSEGETVTIKISFNAKNSFGVPNDETGYFKFKGRVLIDSNR
mgnify:CR=1 FL=1